MVKFKLEALGQGMRSLDSGLSTAVKTLDTGLSTAVKGAGAAAGAVGSGVGGVVGAATNAGLSGVFSLGRGFRDFILRGTVVELAVAVVLGTAFTNLIAAATSVRAALRAGRASWRAARRGGGGGSRGGWRRLSARAARAVRAQDWITPLIGAIFRGSNFQELSFQLNGSTFNYGHFINEFIVFILVCLLLYFAVVVPLEKLQFAAFKHRAILRDCPYCFEEISLAASRCRYCCGELEVDADILHAMEMAEAAIDSQASKSWLSRRFARCFKSKTAVLQETEQGGVEMAIADDEAVNAALPPRSMASATGEPRQAGPPTGTSWRRVSSRGSSAAGSPAASFTGDAPASYLSARSSSATSGGGSRLGPGRSSSTSPPAVAAGDATLDVAALQARLAAAGSSSGVRRF
ncbi:mscL [Scenedesmus sp. PABB004]|nr:mscL [Scenedesmus sp. PABB004]